uniref:Soluble scavenger receptor cysteine-rich domain-containing protein SSC5D n=1 Tax=Amphiprion percula TaxID=161767 RepID=A0A3P8SNG3_AMPPE
MLCLRCVLLCLHCVYIVFTLCFVVLTLCLGRSPTVRLVNGTDRCSGRVEVLHDGQWGTVCDDEWDIKDAQVVCRAMDCGTAQTAKSGAFFGEGQGDIWLDDVNCFGNETSLQHCKRPSFGENNCGHSEDAGTNQCIDRRVLLEVRLANGKDECSGRVEVRHGDVWSTVCDAGWTVDKAQAVCDLLECGRAVTVPGATQFGQGSGSVATADDCFSNATNLQQCSARGFRTATCGHQQDAGAVCAAQVRLAGGATQCSGRVEVFYKGQWGTVCDDEWELSGADVVCRQLGCGHAISAPTSAHFGQGSGPIWLDNVECSGQESALSHCTHLGFGEHNCGHGEDSSAICLGRRSF